MRNRILITIALATGLARRLTGHPVGDIQGVPRSQGSGFNRRGGMAATLAALAVLAATACGSAQTPLSEPVQTPVAEPEPVPAPAAEPSQTSSSEPEVVVSALINAMAANDAEQIRSLFAADASQAYGDGTPQSGEAFFRWLDSDIIDREGRVEDAQLAVNGNEVVVTGQYQSIGYTSEANFLLTVENGRITSWRMRY